MKKLIFGAIIFVSVALLLLYQKQTVRNPIIESLPTFSNTEYCLETDSPYYIQNLEYAVYGNSGFYYVDLDTDYLSFYDIQTGKWNKLCSHPNCTHETADCDGYYDIRFYNTEKGISFYNGNLYLIGNGGDDDRNSTYLYSVSADGSTRTRLVKLFEVEGENSDVDAKCIHRGYLYYTCGDLNDSASDTRRMAIRSLWRVKLEKGAKPELVFQTSEALDMQILRIRGYGDGVFFQTFCYLKDDFSDYELHMYYYSESDDIVYDFLDERSLDYVAVDQRFYYITAANELKYIDLDTGDEVLVKALDMQYGLSYDGTYLVLDNTWGILSRSDLHYDRDRKIAMYTLEGDRVGELDNLGSGNLFCSFSGYMIYESMNQTDSSCIPAPHGIWICEIRDGHDSGEWKCLADNREVIEPYIKTE